MDKKRSSMGFWLLFNTQHVFLDIVSHSCMHASSVSSFLPSFILRVRLCKWALTVLGLLQKLSWLGASEHVCVCTYGGKGLMFASERSVLLCNSSSGFPALAWQRQRSGGQLKHYSTFSLCCILLVYGFLGSEGAEVNSSKESSDCDINSLARS